MRMDRRRWPANARVAHASLAGRVENLPLAEGEPRRIIRPLVDLCAAPGGARDKQMRIGQAFVQLEIHDGWAFGFDVVDGYVGYLPEEVLGPPNRPTHRVTARLTHIYPAPDIKAREQAVLSFFSELEIVGETGRFVELAGGGFVPAAHVAPLSWVAPDPVAVAESFLGTPYLWGGDSGLGIDCSGLVQVALHAAGRACPRDSDQQESLGQAVEGDPQRGDLLFWKGHVALVADAARLIHANAHHMAVAYEGIGAAVARIEAQGDGQVTAHRRIIP